MKTNCFCVPNCRSSCQPPEIENDIKQVWQDFGPTLYSFESFVNTCIYVILPLHIQSNPVERKVMVFSWLFSSYEYDRIQYSWARLSRTKLEMQTHWKLQWSHVSLVRHCRKKQIFITKTTSGIGFYPIKTNVFSEMFYRY